MNHKEFRKHIDDYLLEKLDGTLAEAFEAHYFECDDCFLELKTHELLITKNVPIYLEPSNKTVRSWLPKPALTFASFFLVAVIVLFLFNSYRHNKKLEEISSFSPPIYLQNEIRGTQPEELFSRAMAAYTSKDYGASLGHLQNIRETNNPQVQFFTGMNYLLLKKNRKAIAFFDQIIDAMNPSYYDEAIYHKGIALVRLNKIEKALVEFQNLAQMHSPFASRAKKMIQKVKRLN
jgi:tetratricopeptide (TPR) repeat protein